MTDKGCTGCDSTNDCTGCRLCPTCVNKPLPPGMLPDCGVVAFCHNFRETGPVPWSEALKPLYEPRSFHPDDAFDTIDADTAHRLGLITDELHGLANRAAMQPELREKFLEAEKLLEGEKSAATFVTFQPTGSDMGDNDETVRTDRNVWDFYIDNEGQHRWRCLDLNGENLFSSSEGYTKISDSQKCAKRAGWPGA